MSNQRVTSISRKLPYTATYANGLLTVTTQSNHFLLTGDQVELHGATSINSINVNVTVLSVTEFTVPVEGDQINRYLKGEIIVKFFRAGQSGRFIFNLARSSGSPGVLQSFVTGAGGAVYNLEFSLDGIHWVTGATITHPLIDGDSDFQTVAPAWVYASIDITSIGADTKLEALYSV